MPGREGVVVYAAAMTLVNVALRVDGPDGPLPAPGRLDWRPMAARVDGDTVVVESSFHVDLDAAGNAAVTVAPTGPGWCWRVTETSFERRVRYVLVPDVAEVDYEDLVDVDPDTLGNAPAPASWTLELNVVRGRVEVLEGDRTVTGGTALARGDLISIRSGLLSVWETADPVLAESEVAGVSGTGLIKIGDGVRPFSQLPYVGAVTLEPDDLEAVTMAVLAELQPPVSYTALIANALA